MISRLADYEIRSSLKYVGVLWAGVLVASIFLGLAGKVVDGGLSDQPSTIASIAVVVFTALFGILFVAMLVGTAAVIILRFYKGLLGEEGYLMHTLPVKTGQLIIAKGLVAAGVILITILVSIVSFTVSAGITGFDIWNTLRSFFEAIRECPPAILLIIEAFLIILASILAEIYEIYASLSIGQLTGKHRVLLSIGAYIGIESILNTLGILMISLLVNTSLGERISSKFDSLAMLDTMNTGDIAGKAIMLAQPEIIFVLVLILAEVVIFHIVSERILSRKLNLQ